MSYFPDLTKYSYHVPSYRRNTLNVGWLDSVRGFNTAEPSEALISKLWEFCEISVAQSRGIHQCELCKVEDAYFAIGKNRNLLLGSAEIRVFSEESKIYAAPNLIYHYVKTHHYQPPDEFIEAMFEEQSPPSERYFQRLTEFGLKWQLTANPKEPPRRRSFISPKIEGR